MKIRFYLFFLVIVIMTSNLSAQEDMQEERSIDGYISLFNFGLGALKPLKDYSTRYGDMLSFSVGLEHITKKNFVWNFDYLYSYSDAVKEDVLAPFRTTSGHIYGDDEQIAEIFFGHRGFYLGAGLGYLVQLSKKNRSGLKFSINGGILQHYIKFNDRRNSIGQIRAGRYVGYDRLTRGYALKESIAYKILSANKRLNLEFALDFVQGFTSEVRAYNFDTGIPTIPSRKDWLIGFRVVSSLALYGGTKETIYY